MNTQTTTQKTMRLAELCFPKADEFIPCSTLSQPTSAIEVLTIDYSATPHGMESVRFDPYHDWNDAHRVVDIIRGRGLNRAFMDHLMLGFDDAPGHIIFCTLMGKAVIELVDAALAVLEANA